MTALNILSVVAPPVAARIGHLLWGSLGTPASVNDHDRPVHDNAVTGVLDVGGERVLTYRWGSGRQVIVLVHGWQSRASRFAALLTALASPDRTIVSFDAPGNGDSSGRRVMALDYAEVIRGLDAQFGPIDVIIGHSFGVLSSFEAIREGVDVQAIVSIAGMFDAEFLVDQFCEQAGVTGSAKRGLRRRIERLTFPTIDDPWGRFRSQLDSPDPSIPLLIIQDADDRVVTPDQADRVAAAHHGPVTELRTHGLGHSRVLRDPQVLDAVADFVSTLPTTSPARSRSATAHRSGR